MKMLLQLFIGILFLLPAAGKEKSSFTGNWMLETKTKEGEKMQLKISFFDDGTYCVDLRNDGVIDVKGNYEEKGEYVNIWDTEGEAACGSETVGVYKYSLEGDVLTVERINDACMARGPRVKSIFKRM